MLHFGNWFLKQVLNFHFKLDDIVPRYGSFRKSSFLGTVESLFLEPKVNLKAILWITP